MINRITFVLLLLPSIGCGSPAAPSPLQVSGAWVANSTLAAVRDGECVGGALQAAVGNRDVFTTALRQHESALEATVASPGNGTSCAYSGTVDGSAVTLAMASCQIGRVTGVPCSNGSVRDLQLRAGTIAVDVSSRTTATGTDTSTWDVMAPGNAVSLGTLTLTARFTWIFLGLPSSDYHVFTGTIFPGYADGTISIEGTDAFCMPCGWFPH
jgi:hypothetical protein